MILAISALPWLKKPIESVYWHIHTKYYVLKIRKNKTDATKVVPLIMKGKYRKTRNDFMIVDWKHEVNYDADGFSETKINCSFVNISTEIKEYFTFPIYFARPTHDFQAWAKINGYEYALSFDWDSELGGGLIHIPFPKKLRPHQDMSFQYRHKPVKVLEEGNGWWEWYMARPHSIFRLSITFASPWQISSINSSTIPEVSEVKQPFLKKNHINWNIKAPVLGCKYKIEYKAQKR